MIETQIGKKYIYATLHANASFLASVPGGVWDAIAPPGSVHPYCIFQTQAAHDVVITGGIRLIVESLYLVKIIGPSSFLTLDVIASAMDVLLHDTRGAVTEGSVLSFVRQMPFEMTETVEGGETLRHLGGIYQAQIQQA